MSLWMSLFSSTFFQTRAMLTESRSRVWVSLVSLMVFLFSLGYWMYGSEYLLGSWLKQRFEGGLDDEDIVDDQGSEASEASEAFSASPTRPRASTVDSDPSYAKLSGEVNELKSVLKAFCEKGQSPAPAGAGLNVQFEDPVQTNPQSTMMQSLMHFANGTAPTGAISATAAAQDRARAEAGLRQPISLADHLGGDALPGGMARPSGWAPLAGSARTASQAGTLLKLLSAWQAQSASNPYWAAGFWQDVARLEGETPLEPDLLRMLYGQGYAGAGTLGAPRDTLKMVLETFRSIGAPQLGGGGFQGPAPGLSTAMNFGDDDRWELRLPPDMQRAAPEIYRNMRSEAAGNIREWIQQRYQGEKSNKNQEWVSLWAMAIEVDFDVAEARREGKELQNLLASKDGLEIRLRHLAAHSHMVRTGDVNSATNMLALKHPGTCTDVSPNWLVNESSTYSQDEYKRLQRVKGGRGKGDGWKADKPPKKPKGGGNNPKGGDGPGGAPKGKP